MTSFHLIIAITALLIMLGLTMVLSASGVHSYYENGSPWAIFGRQVLWTVVGLLAFYIALRMPVQLMRSMAFSRVRPHHRHAGLGADPGNRQGSQRFSRLVRGRRILHAASELAKIAFAIWGAHLLAARRLERASLRRCSSRSCPPP